MVESHLQNTERLEHLLLDFPMRCLRNTADKRHPPLLLSERVDNQFRVAKLDGPKNNRFRFYHHNRPKLQKKAHSKKIFERKLAHVNKSPYLCTR
jgi:hypothetical protein